MVHMSTKKIFRQGKIPIVSSPGVKEALGQSESFLSFQENLSRAARVDRPVLLVGERGTGKELAASRIHYLSQRWQAPMVTLNCAALSSTLIESELFGYERGAFTGAELRRKGRFESAHEGTLFLDEISSIPIQVQEKILRVVEYGSFERVGSSEAVEVDVRIVGATNQDLAGLAREGRFKEDLLDRLSFDVLFLPPLRERKGDIPLLAGYFAARMAGELGQEEIPCFSDEAVRAMEEYRWPGNIRELKNIVERAVYRSESATIRSIEFNPFQGAGACRALREDGGSVGSESGHREDGRPEGSFEETVESFEVSLIARALQSARFNQRRAASTLGLTYHQFRGLFRKYRSVLESKLKTGFD
jgi:psp operon transcriptional activator